MVSSLETNKALVRKGIEVFNSRDWAQFDQVFAPECKFHAGIEGLALGPRGARQLAARVGTAWPDDHWTIDRLLADDDRVVALITSRATHLGRWMGMPPTGTRVECQAVWIFRVDDGRIAEGWWIADDQARLRQLGFDSQK